ncbi:MAG TPA: amidohydrolase family protein [Stellaceae bacterium]|jgi:predicted TIM-barrel fold metal-dependent hydrolase
MGTPHRIDVHHHFVPQIYKEALIALGSACPAPGYQLPIANWTVERSIDQMDEAGIAVAITSVTTPGIHFGDDAAAQKLARQCNDAGAKLVQARPRRFGLFAALPLPAIDTSLEEIAYALDQLKADGIGLYTNYETGGVKFLGDPEFRPVLEELDRREAVVFVHPTSCLCCSDLQPAIADAIIEYGTDTTRTIASLVFSGAAARYPNIRFIFCHAGGTMPYLIQRFIDFSGRDEVAMQAAMLNGMMHELTRFFYDLAQTAHPGPVGALRNIIPNSQILFGTDYPYGFGCLDQVQRIAACGFSAAELASIDRTNALALLPRFA